MAQPKGTTPGPWAVFDTHPKKSCFYIDCHDQSGEHAIGEVAVIYTTTDATKRANARLIAAAPDLYAVVRELSDLCPRMSDDDPIGPAIRDAIMRGRAALAKAEGRDAL